MAAPFTPNPFAPDGRAPWTVITFGAGAPVKAALTEINNVKVKFLWKKAKSKETSGSLNTYSGQEWEQPECTFECGDGDGFTAEECLEDLWQLYCTMQPVPGQTGSAPAATPTPGQTFAIGSPAKAEKPAAGGAAASTETDTSTKKDDAKKDDPGPRPPTIAVGYPALMWLGITAVALVEWELVGFTEDNGYKVKIKLIPDKPPVKAGTGAQAAPAPGSQFAGGAAGNAGGGGAGGAGGSTGAPSITTNAQAGAAGT